MPFRDPEEAPREGGHGGGPYSKALSAVGLVHSRLARQTQTQTLPLALEVQQHDCFLFKKHSVSNPFPHFKSQPKRQHRSTQPNTPLSECACPVGLERTLRGGECEGTWRGVFVKPTAGLGGSVVACSAGAETGSC